MRIAGWFNVADCDHVVLGDRLERNASFPWLVKFKVKKVVNVVFCSVLPASDQLNQPGTKRAEQLADLVGVTRYETNSEHTARTKLWLLGFLRQHIARSNFHTPKP